MRVNMWRKKIGVRIPVGEAGFTALELMITSALSTIVLGTLFVAMQAGDVQLQGSDVRMTLQDSAREGIYRMIQEMRHSAPTRVTISNGGGSVQFSIPDTSTPTNSSYSIDWTAAETVQYCVTGVSCSGNLSNTDCNQDNQVCRILTANGSTTYKVLANNVTGMTFTGNSGSPTVVTIALNAQRTLKNGRMVPATPLQLTGQAEIRNT